MIPLALAPAVGFLKRIPRAAWIALAVIAILGLGTCAHKKAVKKHYAEAYAAGVAYEAARIEKKAKAIAARAETISQTLRSKNDAEVRRISSDARTVLVRGAGKASCSNASPIGTSGRNASSGAGNAAVDPVPSGEGVELIGLPFADLVGFAERCDLNRREVLTWREWHRLLVEDYEKQR